MEFKELFPNIRPPKKQVDICYFHVALKSVWKAYWIELKSRTSSMPRRLQAVREAKSWRLSGRGSHRKEGGWTCY